MRRDKNRDPFTYPEGAYEDSGAPQPPQPLKEKTGGARKIRALKDLFSAKRAGGLEQPAGEPQAEAAPRAAVGELEQQAPPAQVEQTKAPKKKPQQDGPAASDAEIAALKAAETAPGQQVAALKNEAQLAAPVLPNEPEQQPPAEPGPAKRAKKPKGSFARREAEVLERAEALRKAAAAAGEQEASQPTAAPEPPQPADDFPGQSGPQPEAPLSAWRRGWNGFKNMLPRLVAAFVFAALLLLPLFAFYSYEMRVGYVYEGDSRVATLLLSGSNYEQVVAQELQLREEDIVEYVETGVSANLYVQRANEITVTADGASATLYLHDTTVADALAKAGVELGEDDIVEPALESAITGDCGVTVRRVVYEYETVTELDAGVDKFKPSPLISEGTEVFCGEGRDGLAERTYRIPIVDGERGEPEVYEESILSYKRDTVTLVGDPDVAASHIEGSEFTDVQIIDGVPESYEFMIEDAVCTAYSAGPGTYGASGMLLIQGFVAVDPAVIPYGSLMYITSGDENGFVYGWAVAADVGTAMVEGYVDIDCFFETYRESVLFGKKWLNVYVVDQLNQEELSAYIRQAGMFYARIPE